MKEAMETGGIEGSEEVRSTAPQDQASCSGIILAQCFPFRAVAEIVCLTFWTQRQSGCGVQDGSSLYLLGASI